MDSSNLRLILFDIIIMIRFNIDSKNGLIRYDMIRFNMDSKNGHI